MKILKNSQDVRLCLLSGGILFWQSINNHYKLNGNGYQADKCRACKRTHNSTIDLYISFHRADHYNRWISSISASKSSSSDMIKFTSYFVLKSEM